MSHNPKSAVRVVVWNEFYHERHDPAVKAIYPDGLHTVIAAGLTETARIETAGIETDGIEVSTATLEDPGCGLTAERLHDTDVLIWWGHARHADVPDDVVGRVRARVLAGMGLIVLHSGHFSKIFRALMGTSCDLKWREAGERERLWVVAPGHPITAGIGEYIQLEEEEMYGEHFDIPAPDELVFISWFAGGEVFRSGCCYRRGQGRIFYFRPGHETHPTYFNPDVRRVIRNAVNWAAPVPSAERLFGNVRPLEPLD